MTKADAKSIARRFYDEDIAPRLPSQPERAYEQGIIEAIASLILQIRTDARHHQNCPTRKSLNIDECICT